MKDLDLSQVTETRCMINESKIVLPMSTPSNAKPVEPNPIPTKAQTLSTSFPEQPMDRPRSWTSPWYACRLRDQKPSQAMTLLQVLVHPRCHPEATPEVLEELNHLTVEEATDAIQELCGPKHFICGSGSSLTVPAQLSTLDDQPQFSLCALVDSGCTGSSIDAGYVQAKGLNTQPLSRPVSVYNTDGTLNNSRSITHTVTLRLTIGQHSEHITFGVTNLGKSDLFLGHEWLKYHNPTIDWEESTLKFDRCPKRCRQLFWIPEPEDEEDPDVVERFPEGIVEEGECVFAFDFYSYRTETRMESIDI